MARDNHENRLQSRPNVGSERPVQPVTPITTPLVDSLQSSLAPGAPSPYVAEQQGLQPATATGASIHAQGKAHMDDGYGSRRFFAGLIRVGLVALALAIVVGWVQRRATRIAHGANNINVELQAPPPAALGPGDMRIYNSDSSVDLI